MAISEICASLAKRYDLRDDAQRVKGVSYVVVAAYAADCPETPKQPIWLEASVEDGKLSLSLFHAKWHEAKIARYVEIQNALVSDFRERFGAQAIVRIYDEVIK